MHTTIYSISESPKDKNTIWVGTDDGNVQVTRDAGKTWANVTANVPNLPPNSWVSWVQASNFEPGVAMPRSTATPLAITLRICIARADFGKTWTPLVTPQEISGVQGYAHVIKEDIVKPNILFLGTELGLWISVDTGKTWAQFKGKPLPERRGPRHRDSAARQRARPRHSRPRHLGGRRHHAAARAHT
jgi:photosystem II stability/assembly factor-like uncharacterized protein